MGFLSSRRIEQLKALCQNLDCPFDREQLIGVDAQLCHFGQTKFDCVSLSFCQYRRRGDAINRLRISFVFLKRCGRLPKSVFETVERHMEVWVTLCYKNPTVVTNTRALDSFPILPVRIRDTMQRAIEESQG
jgi:hypothetical protein